MYIYKYISAVFDDYTIIYTVIIYYIYVWYRFATYDISEEKEKNIHYKLFFPCTPTSSAMRFWVDTQDSIQSKFTWRYVRATSEDDSICCSLKKAIARYSAFHTSIGMMSSMPTALPRLLVSNGSRVESHQLSDPMMIQESLVEDSHHWL